MVTADQLVAHLVGDYILQSDWMANRKRVDGIAAAVHAIVYSLPFLLFRPSLAAMLVIYWTHFLIDRFGLARYVVWAKNFLAPRWRPEGWQHHLQTRNQPWVECQATGYSPERPVWLSVWLTIIADNVLHILINGAALRWL